MYINWLVLVCGLYFSLTYFFVKVKHELGFVLYGKCLIRAKEIRDKSKLESDISFIQLIFGVTLVLGSIIEPNIITDILIYLVLGFYVLKSYNIKKNVLQGLYD